MKEIKEIENKKTIAEDNIELLPYSGHIFLTFIRLIPNVRIIHKRIPLQYLSKEYKQVYDDLENSGVSLNLESKNVKLSDYYKFVCKLFPEFNVQDNQYQKVGQPDFFLTNRHTEFYLEVKNGIDGIRSTQMDWLANNPNKEVWFMFIGGIKDVNINESGRPISYYENP
ncbi:MAG: hypothetical protein KKF48_05860 [Nanoarchaeota archaeon]|nr:hypothetical protein [Nanoarchaeota archaeon]